MSSQSLAYLMNCRNQPLDCRLYYLSKVFIGSMFVQLKNVGELNNGIEETKDWDEARDSYRLKEKNGVTELDVEMDAIAEFEQYFNDTFPKALNRLKQIAEQ